MEVHANLVSGSFQGLDSKSSALSNTAKVDQTHTINSGTVDSETDSRISSLAKQTMGTYEVLHDRKTNTTFLVEKGAEIKDAQMQTTLKKAKHVSGTRGISKVVSQEKIEEKFDDVTKGLITRDGTLHKPYSEGGKTKYYNTGMTPDSLKSLLSESMKTQSVSKSFFQKIAEKLGFSKPVEVSRTFQVIHASGHSEKFYSISNEDNQKEQNLVHVGSFIAKGGGGTVNKAWDLGENQIHVMKQTLSNVSAKQIKQGRAPTDIEARNLQRINPSRNEGVQHAPYAVFRSVNNGVVQAGFLTQRYDGDLSTHIASVDGKGQSNEAQTSFTTDQIISAGKQIFSGITLLNQKNVANTDIKSANLFVRKLEDDSYEFHIADFDQARFMDDSLFTSEEFQKNPVGGSSSDSVSPNAHSWIKKTGKAITDRQNILNLKPEEKKQNIVRLKGKREDLQKKANQAKDEKTKSRLENSLKEYDSALSLLQTPNEELKLQLETLKEGYRGIMRDVHTASSGHLLYQMLNGDVNPRIQNADFKNLKQIIAKDTNLSPEEKKDRLKLAALAENCMGDFPDPPSFVDSETSFPTLDVTSQGALRKLESLKSETEWRF